MKRAKIVTFKPPALKARQYKVTGYWGGNVACEYSVTIEGSESRKK